MNRKKSIKNILRAVCLLFCFLAIQVVGIQYIPVNAASAENAGEGIFTNREVDITKTGSIRVKEKQGQGISYSLYQIEKFDAEGNAYYVGDFSTYESEIPLAADLITNADEAEAFAENIGSMITNHGIGAYATGSTNAEGLVTFSNLAPGYYFIQAEAFTTSEGKVFTANPVIVSLPGSEEADNYHITVESKSEMITPETPSEIPPTNDTPKDTPKPVKPAGILPQTGVLWWPVPVLFVLGLLLYAAGYIMELRKNKN